MSKSYSAWSLAVLVSLSPAAVSSPAAFAQSSEVRAAQTPLFEPQPDASEQKILAALADQTEIQFVDQPLNDVVESLKERHGIEIQLDNKALADAGLGSETPVTRNIGGIRLESALNLMLGEMDLTYVIRDQVLMITSKTEAENMLLDRFYPVGDLLNAEHDDLVAGDGDEYRRLNELISSLVAPTTWDEVGGPGRMKAVPGARALAISQTFEIHREIEHFLAALRAVKQRRPDQPPPRAEADEHSLHLKIYKLPAAWAAHRDGRKGAAPTVAPPAAVPPADGDAKTTPHVQTPAARTGDAAPPHSPTVDQLAAAVPAVIEPDSWSASGGDGAISIVGNALAVRQTDRVHREIRRFLQALGSSQ
jgi:hypothetical protein